MSTAKGTDRDYWHTGHDWVVVPLTLFVKPEAYVSEKFW